MMISSENISSGFDHIETVGDLHYGKSVEENFAAIESVQEWLGMDEGAKRILLERIGSFVPREREDVYGWVLMGYLVGLTTAQYAAESV